jgi:hypothetical protein
LNRRNRRQNAQSQKPAVADHERPRDGSAEYDHDVPELGLVKPGPTCEGLDTLAVPVEWLALNSDFFNCRANIRVSERMQHGARRRLLFFQPLGAFLGVV